MSFDCRWIHHDGSHLYVSNAAPQPGDKVEVRVRLPRAAVPEHVFVRTLHDGEPKVVRAEKQSSNEVEHWWAAELPILNEVARYRWGFAGGNVGYGWLTAAGWFSQDCTDAHDFALSTAPLPPAWLKSAVVYQIFPDRFASSGRIKQAPEWAVPRRWDQHPEGRGKNTSKEWFGGDLWAVIDRLDYLQDLGVDTLYFTPFFPAGSTHRYDASTFDKVDDLLGGDEAFISLVEAAHSRGMKVIGDITLNHSGIGHEWFLRAMEGDPVHAGFYTFNPSYEYGYAAWLNVRTLPKFNYRSEQLRQDLIAGHDSVIRKWLRPPFSLDGWRVDVANMTGRQGEYDENDAIARLTRAAVAEEGEDKALVAEHFHDAGVDLDGHGWQGAMNYSAFMKPVWSWLISDAYRGDWLGLPVPVPQTTGMQMVTSIRSFASRMPWRSYLASWSLLCSHDTARIRSVVGSFERQLAAAGLLFTLPGTPMLFAGDEIGAEGQWGEDSRTTFPWDRPDKWDQQSLTAYRELIALRRDSAALAEGGLRWVAVVDDAVLYLRETESERLLVAVSRAAADLEFNASMLGIGPLVQIAGSTHAAQTERTISMSGAGYVIWRVSQ